MKYKRLYVFAVVINSLKDCRKYVKKKRALYIFSRCKFIFIFSP